MIKSTSNRWVNTGVRLIKTNRSALFIFLLLLIYYFLNYHLILFLPPQGIHFIRQTDSLSFVMHYINHGMYFFEPGGFNLISYDGKAACEFPLLYYITAYLYKVLGEHEFILRLINLAIVSFGLFSLFRLLVLLVKDVFYAFVFTFLFLSSTILIYYSNNYLPDAPAFGFALAGWYYSYLYILDGKRKRALIAGLTLFTISSLIKVTCFINPLAFVLSIIVIDAAPIRQFRLFLKTHALLLILFTLSGLLVLTWNLYAIHYNTVNHNNYFLLQTRPIWSLERKEIHSVYDHMVNFWYSEYYFQSTLHVFAALILSGLFLIRYSNRKLLVVSFFLLAGSIGYFLLFFDQFRNHDYYFIALIPCIVFMCIGSFISLSNWIPRLVYNYLTRLLFLLLCLLSLNYARYKLEIRYDTRNDLFSGIGNKLDGTRVFLDSHGMNNEKVVLITDLTLNGGLYYLNHMGWTLKDTSEMSLQYMKNYLHQGAGIIILTDRKYIDNPNISKYLGKKMGEINNILVYKCVYP